MTINLTDNEKAQIKKAALKTRDFMLDHIDEFESPDVEVTEIIFGNLEHVQKIGGLTGTGLKALKNLKSWDEIESMTQGWFN